MIPTQSISIDEEGFPLMGELRVKDEELGASLLAQLRFAENNAFMTTLESTDVLVEAFDEPIVAQHLERPEKGQSKWILIAPYQVRFPFELKTLSVDEWDRFHGLLANGIPFVFSRKAQAEFFNLVDDYDDDAIVVEGHRYELPAWHRTQEKLEDESYWSDAYRTETPGWELNAPAPALVDMLPRLKLPKQRVLVLGCGSGNDAAFFAEHGHLVTAVDFSPEAIERAKQKYSHLSNLRFVEKDVFQLPSDWTHSFDLVFEHTCFCAIPPERRNELISVWRRMLAPGGQLMAIFFVMERNFQPPFGATEWELRQRLKKLFHFQFWGRWKNSIGRRNGKELFVLATKLD